MIDGMAPASKVALGMNEIAEAFGRLGGFAGDAAKLADEYAGLTGRLKLAVGEGEAFTRALDQVRQIAGATGADIGATATLFGQLTTATKELGLSQSQVATLTESINKSFVVSGASAAETAGAVRQLAQGLASGVLRGNEFNSVMENSPRLAKALSDGLHVTTGALREMAEEGKLTAEVITKALAGQADAIAADFAKMPRTIGQSMQAAKNEFLLFVGELDKAKGVSAGVVSAIDGLTKHIDELGKVALSVGAVAFAGMATKIAAAFAASGMAVRQSIVDMQAKRAADLSAAQAGIVHAEAEKKVTFDTLEAARASQAAAQATLLESQARLRAASEAAVYGMQRAAAERGVTAARAELTAATAALTAAERVNMVSTGQLVDAKKAATVQSGLLATAMKALPLPANIMLAVAGFEALTAAGKWLGESLAKMSGDMKAVDAAGEKFRHGMKLQAMDAEAVAHGLSNYKEVVIATAGEIARMTPIEKAAYEQRIAKAMEYQHAAIKAAEASEAIGRKTVHSSQEASKALQDLKAGLAAFQDSTRVFTSIGAAIDDATKKLLTGFNAALHDAEVKGEGAHVAIAKLIKAADFTTPTGIAALANALADVEKRGIATGQVLDKELSQRIAKLSTEDLAALGISSQTAFAAMGVDAGNAARVIDGVLAESFKRLGVDVRKMKDGVGKDFSDLEIVFNHVAESGKASGRELVAAFSGLVKKAQTAEEFRHLETVFEELKRSGKLSADEIARAYGDMAAKIAAAGSLIDSSLGDALTRLGIKSVDQMQRAAASIEADFDKIAAAAKRGEVSVDQAGVAFEKYAKTAIEANNGVVSAQLKADAAAAGMTDRLAKLADANTQAAGETDKLSERIDKQAKITELGMNADVRAADAKVRTAKAALDKAKATGDEAAATEANNALMAAEIERADAVVRQKNAVAQAARAKADALRKEAEADGMVTDAERLAIAQADDYANSTYHEAQAAGEAAGAARDKAAALREAAAAAQLAKAQADDYTSSTHQETQAAGAAASAIRDKAAALNEEAAAAAKAAAAENARRWPKDGMARNTNGDIISEQGGTEYSQKSNQEIGLLTAAWERGDRVFNNAAGKYEHITQEAYDGAQKELAARDAESKQRREQRAQAQKDLLAKLEEEHTIPQTATARTGAGTSGGTAAMGASAGASAGTSAGTSAGFGGTQATGQNGFGDSTFSGAPAQTVRIELKSPSGVRSQVYADRRQTEGLIAALRDAGMAAGSG